MKYLIILKGCPGSGKSTYAKRLSKKFFELYSVKSTICSADDFFMVNGSYVYDPAKIGLAHMICFKKAAKAFESGTTLVIIDNTNTKLRDYKKYIDAAVDYKIVIRTIGETTDEFIKLCCERNIHSVPEETIKRMAKNLKDNLGANDGIY